MLHAPRNGERSLSALQIELARKRETIHRRRLHLVEQKALVEKQLALVKMADEEISKLKHQTAQLLEKVSATLESGTQRDFFNQFHEKKR